MNEQTETKVRRTLSDAVEAYGRKAIKAAEEEAERIAELEAETRELLSKANLDYHHLEEGNLVVFEYDGGFVKIRLWGNEQRMHIQRIGTCSVCGREIRSWSKDWVTTLDDFGELAVNPSWDHVHYPQQEETAEQRLVSALRELLDTGGE